MDEVKVQQKLDAWREFARALAALMAAKIVDNDPSLEAAIKRHDAAMERLMVLGETL